MVHGPADRLASLLADRAELDQLRTRAAAGDLNAGFRLTDLLADRGELDLLRARADAGDTRAADRLIDLLAARGDKQELEKEVFAGYSLGLHRLVNIWFHGDSDAANFNLRLRMFGLEPEGSIFDRASES